MTEADIRKEGSLAKALLYGLAVPASALGYLYAASKGVQDIRAAKDPNYANKRSEEYLAEKERLALKNNPIPRSNKLSPRFFQ
jgi:hypothetical protein